MNKYLKIIILIIFFCIFSICIASDNPYLDNFSSSVNSKLERFVYKLEQEKIKKSNSEFILLVDSLLSELTKLKNLYPDNTTLHNFVWYFDYEITRMKSDISNDWTTNISLATLNVTDTSSLSATKIFSYPQINWIHILSNHWGTLWITEFCKQNWYTRATNLKTEVLSSDKRKVDWLYWNGDEKFYLYYDILKEEDSFDYAENLDEYWNIVTEVTCIDDNAIIIDERKRITEDKCDNIVEYWNIKFCTTSIKTTYEEKDSICPTGYKVPNPAELAQVLYSDNRKFTSESPFLEIFPQWTYILAWKLSWYEYLYSSYNNSSWSKKIVSWMQSLNYTKSDKYLMCYSWPDISMDNYEMSTWFNYYMWGEPSWICNWLYSKYEWYTIINYYRDYLLDWEKVIFNWTKNLVDFYEEYWFKPTEEIININDENNTNIVMSCDSWNLLVKTEEEYEEYIEQIEKEAQEELEKQQKEQELLEEAEKLWCEILEEYWDIRLCEIWKKVYDSELEEVSCPEWYKIPNYWEMTYILWVNLNSSKLTKNYWLNSQYKDTHSMSIIPQNQEDNRYYIKGINWWIPSTDNSSYYRKKGISGYNSNYNVLCYKWLEINKDYINNCNLKSFYSVWEIAYINNSWRTKLLEWESIKLTHNNLNEIVILCSWNEISVELSNID